VWALRAASPNVSQRTASASCRTGLSARCGGGERFPAARSGKDRCRDRSHPLDCRCVT
jgi:hypothetical protein